MNETNPEKRLALVRDEDRQVLANMETLGIFRSRRRVKDAKNFAARFPDILKPRKDDDNIPLSEFIEGFINYSNAVERVLGTYPVRKNDNDDVPRIGKP